MRLIAVGKAIVQVPGNRALPVAAPAVRGQRPGALQRADTAAPGVGTRRPTGAPLDVVACRSADVSPPTGNAGCPLRLKRRSAPVGAQRVHLSPDGPAR